MATVNFTGLASGLDTRALIDAILNAERAPIERLQARESRLNLKQTAFDELRSKIGSFESALRALSRPSTVRAKTASVSDETALKASAGSSAELGLFSIDVLTLAAADKVRSDGLAAADTALVSDGTITIQSGSKGLITVDVSAANGNNTLEAVRDEINAADAGVSASILYDGTNYLLVVRADETGTANALSITDGTNLNLDSGGNVVTSAADATLTIDGISVTSSSNRITGTIPGVTLDLLRTTSGSPVTLEVAPDIDGVAGAIQNLITEYNELIDFFNSQDNIDDPGPLAGDFTLRRTQLDLQTLITGGVQGLPIGKIRSLSALGVDFDGKTGRASVDSAELRSVLESKFDEVGDLFLTSRKTSDPRISYVSSTSATVDGTYTVEVTQAAEQATLLGSAAIKAAGLKKDETLTIDVNGQTSVVNLLAGQDTAAVVAAINSQLAADGTRAEAVNENGFVRISTTDYGSSEVLTVTSSLNDSGNGKQSGFDDTPASDSGLDVAGSIGGVAASGSGQLLTGADGEPFEGLVLRVTATASDVAATGGDFGTIELSGGLAKQLLARTDRATEFGTGTIELAKESIRADLERIAEDVLRLEDRIAAREARLLRAFSAAERAIAALQTQQASLGNAVTLF